MLLIIDNQSKYINHFKRDYLDEQDIPFKVLDHNEPIDFSRIGQIQGLILSGGRGNPYSPLNLTTNFVALINIDVPTIGFCLGHEIIAVAYKARIKRLKEPQNRKVYITLSNSDDPLFEGLTNTQVRIQKKHQFNVTNLREPLTSLAYSDVSENEIIRHRDKPIYGFQGHPEVSGQDGLLMMRNFLRMCDFDVE